jgi:hypothetical protein
MYRVGIFTSVFTDNKSLRSHKTAEIKDFLLFLIVDGRIRSRIQLLIRIWNTVLYISYQEPLALAKCVFAGVEKDWRLHLQHAAEDCQTPGGDTGPQEPEPPARGQPS